MTNLYIVSLRNRFSEAIKNEYFLNKANAEARVAEVANIYAEAKAKGQGEHWGNVIYEGHAWINEVVTED